MNIAIDERLILLYPLMNKDDVNKPPLPLDNWQHKWAAEWINREERRRQEYTPPVT